MPSPHPLFVPRESVGQPPIVSFFLLWFSASRRITSKDKVARFGLLVAGEAAFHKRRVARFAVLEVSEPPAAGCGVLG